MAAGRASTGGVNGVADLENVSPSLVIPDYFSCSVSIYLATIIGNSVAMFYLISYLFSYSLASDGVVSLLASREGRHAIASVYVIL